MLIVFPVGLLLASLAFDVIHLAADSAVAATVAHALIATGVIAGLLAAPWGAVDWHALPANTRAKRVGAAHGAGNVLVLVLFAASGWLRSAAPEAPSALALGLAFAGALVLLLTAWLGGELVDRLGVGVSPHANLDARSSLEGPALPPMHANEPRAGGGVR